MSLPTALAASAESAEPEAVHGGFSVGLGTAYDRLGGRLEIGSNHFGVFGAFFEVGLRGGSYRRLLPQSCESSAGQLRDRPLPGEWSSGPIPDMLLGGGLDF